MKIVEVTWVDISYKDAGWHHWAEVEQFFRDKEENTVIQIGYIYKETDELLCLVDSYFKDDKIYGTTHKIPKGCIIDIKELKTA